MPAPALAERAPTPPVAAERGRSSAGPAPKPSDDRAAISLEWLIRLRWGAVVGQLVTIAAAEAMFGGLPLARLLVLVGLQAASNAFLTFGGRRLASPRWLCGAAATLDTLVLTGLLNATGGASNPFSVIYLVHIALAAVVLGPRWTWSLALLSVGCYGLLFVIHRPLSHEGHSGTELSIHLQGMWVAFTMAALLTTYFVVKLSTALERREAAMAEMQQRAARQERLASVTTLAAGAAHELGTPLATIAVASRELERSIEALPAGQGEGLIADARLIRSELERCRAILGRLAADSGQAQGEAPVELQLQEVFADVVGGVPATFRGRLVLGPPPPPARLSVPRAALLQVSQNLLQNAFEAGPGPVTLSLEVEGSRLRLRVRDEGPGMPADVLVRVGEPFFSTKPPGRGLGLGVFIARSLSEQMGGRLILESSPGQGTTATVEIAGVEAAPGRADAR